jgi:hypothetical protein
MAIWYVLCSFGKGILWSFGIFCGHLVYFVGIWYILWAFGIFCGHLVYFVGIWYRYLVVIWHILRLYIPHLVHCIKNIMASTPIFKKLAEVNNRTMGEENSPNLFTPVQKPSQQKRLLLR